MSYRENNANMCNDHVNTERYIKILEQDKRVFIKYSCSLNCKIPYIYIYIYIYVCTSTVHINNSNKEVKTTRILTMLKSQQDITVLCCSM